MKYNKIGSTDLVCLDCGNVSTIMRRSGRYKKVSHIKDLWCYKCMRTTKHFEVVDVDKFMMSDSNNRNERYVRNLIINDRARTNKILKKKFEE